MAIGWYPKAGVKPRWLTAMVRGQGVCREAGSERFEENCRVVIEKWSNPDELVGQRQRMVEPALRGRKRYGSSLSHQGVCRRHGKEDY